MKKAPAIAIATATVTLITVATVSAIRVWNEAYGNIVTTAPLDTSCMAHKNDCKTEFVEGGQVRLSIQPRPVKGAQPLQINVSLQDIRAHKVEVEFQGIGMYTGFNRPTLALQSDGEYSGTAILSVCALDRMSWNANVLISTDDGVIAAPFYFESTH